MQYLLAIRSGNTKIEPKTHLQDFLNQYKYKRRFIKWPFSTATFGCDFNRSKKEYYRQAAGKCLG